MNDMTGAEVNIGDFLIDDRGKTFLAQANPPSYDREKLITVTELRKRGVEKLGFMRQAFALKVSEGQLRTSQDELKGLWRHNYERYQHPKNREAIKKKRELFQERRKQRGDR